VSWVLIPLTLLALLAVPVDVAFSARRRERLNTRLSVRWLWGRVPLPVPEGGGGSPRRKRRNRHPKPGTPSRARRGLAMVRSEDFPRRVLRLFGDLARRVRVRRLELDLRLGLDDPADTGRLWGLIGPASAMLALPPPARIAITPEFAGSVLHLDAHGSVRIVPAALVAVMLAFLLSPITLRAMFAALRGTP